MRTQWFQQDWAQPHTARATRQFLRTQFPGRVISLYENIEWPLYSPDLKPQTSSEAIWRTTFMQIPSQETLNYSRQTSEEKFRTFHVKNFLMWWTMLPLWCELSLDEKEVHWSCGVKRKGLMCKNGKTKLKTVL